jgi:hypothetical protein
MRRILAALAITGTALLSVAGPAAAWQPPGQRGYEGQPGHQSGQHGNHHAPGLLGYEGQPGNQGG